VDSTQTHTRPQAGESLVVRWLIRRDIPSVLACGPEGWTEGEIVRRMRRSGVIGHVTTDPAGAVLGWVLYSLERRPDGRRWVRLLAVAVRPEHRRRGVGRKLLEYVRDKAIRHGYRAVVVGVPEENLTTHLLLRSAGYRCERGGDTLRFVLTLGIRWTWGRDEIGRSRCGRWRVHDTGEGWLLEDRTGRELSIYLGSPAECWALAEEISRRG